MAPIEGGEGSVMKYLLLAITMLVVLPGCSKKGLKDSYITVCENRTSPGMRSRIKAPGGLTDNLDCREVADKYHTECEGMVTNLKESKRYSYYLNCMHGKASEEGFMKKLRGE